MFKFFNSPFSEDQKYAVLKTLQIARDEEDKHQQILSTLYFSKIQKILCESYEEVKIHQSFDILCYMLDSSFHRLRFVQEGCLKDVFNRCLGFANDVLKQE